LHGAPPKLGLIYQLFDQQSTKTQA